MPTDEAVLHDQACTRPSPPAHPGSNSTAPRSSSWAASIGGRYRIGHSVMRDARRRWDLGGDPGRRAGPAVPPAPDRPGRAAGQRLPQVRGEPGRQRPRPAQRDAGRLRRPLAPADQERRRRGSRLGHRRPRGVRVRVGRPPGPGRRRASGGDRRPRPRASDRLPGPMAAEPRIPGAYSADTGTAEPAVTAALSAYDAGTGGREDVMAALTAARLLVPVVACSTRRGSPTGSAPKRRRTWRRSRQPGWTGGAACLPSPVSTRCVVGTRGRVRFRCPRRWPLRPPWPMVQTRWSSTSPDRSCSPSRPATCNGSDPACRVRQCAGHARGRYLLPLRLGRDNGEAQVETLPPAPAVTAVEVQVVAAR